MMLTVYLCISIILLVLVFHTSLHYSKFGRTINKIPGLPPIPLFGNLLQMWYPFDEVWPKVRYFYEKYYPTYKIWSLVKPIVFLRHPEDLKILLSCKKNIDKCDQVYDNLRFAGSDGILSNNGQRWQNHRKILNHAFTTNHLEIYTEKTNERAKKFAAELRSRGDVFVDNITPMFLKFALAAVCDAVMDVDNDSLPPGKEKEFRTAVTQLFEITLQRAFRPYIRNFMMPFLPIGWRLERVRKMLASFRNEIIQTRRKYHESMGYAIESDMDNTDNGLSTDTNNHSLKGIKKNIAVVDTLLLAEKKGLIDFHDVSEEVITITGAGYETTGMAISFLLALLAENQQQQDLARKEVLEILGDDEYITVKHTKSMAYLDRCVKESLRLFPTAPHLGRYITNDIRLHKHTLPAGAIVMMSIIELHKDRNFWPEPDKFEPDRFLPENVKKRHPFAYLPFSAGLRNCIGQKFAIAEMKLVAAHILYNFYLEPVDLLANLKQEMHFTIKCEHINMKFIRIDRN